MPTSLITILLLISLSSTILSFIFFLYLSLREKRESQKMLDQTINKARSESATVLNQAIAEAQQIIGQAKVDEQKMVEQEKAVLAGFEQSASNQFNQAATETEKLLQTQINEMKAQMLHAQKAYFEYLQFAKTQIDQSKDQNEQMIKASLSNFFERIEQNVSQFLSQAEQQSANAIDLELKATRNLIETYKQQQFNLIDENVIAILERTTALILAKKLTLKDQSDLIFESLEQAKVEKFIG